MSIKLKALGLATLAALAAGVFGAIDAGAEGGGHFVADVATSEATVLGSEVGEHGLSFKVNGIEGKISCEQAAYDGTTTATATELRLTPIWSECTTAGSEETFDIDENGCALNLTVNSEPETSHNTAHIECPTEKAIEITHPSCNIQIPSQTIEGLIYKTDEIAGKHALTLESTVEEITTHFESFGCQLVFGTSKKAELNGSTTLQTLDFPIKPVDITAASKHFTADAETEEVTVLGSETGEHGLSFKVNGVEGEIGCNQAAYDGITANTAEELQLTPAWSECTTAGSEETFDIDENGCTIGLTVNAEPETSHNAAHIECPEEKAIEITHPSCNIQIPSQTIEGLIYKTDEIAGKHAITLESTAEEITADFESFGCILVFGTKQEAELNGSVTLQALAPPIEPVDVTAASEHFTADAEAGEATVVGSEVGEHGLSFKVNNVEGEIGCNQAAYDGITANTAEELQLTPAWSECTTAGSEETFDIDENGCTIGLTVNAEPETSHNAAHIECPEEKAIEITHPNCNIQIPPQTIEGLIYKTDEIAGKHALTLESTVEEITTHFESFGCVLLFGTKQEAELNGSVTLQALAPPIEPVDVTAT